MALFLRVRPLASLLRRADLLHWFRFSMAWGLHGLRYKMLWATTGVPFVMRGTPRSTPLSQDLCVPSGTGVLALPSHCLTAGCVLTVGIRFGWKGSGVLAVALLSASSRPHVFAVASTREYY